MQHLYLGNGSPGSSVFQRNYKIIAGVINIFLLLLHHSYQMLPESSYLALEPYKEQVSHI